ncbi:4-hydroxytryptamine kinase [Frankliniella fusca]|uniref:4-hydroxytryptamine kinase n=1 Tax=Frankliniella fusca TaxID=407009 RepID=A0AAE1HTA8_9NEOP|nr:4-hydroxytryptamine kinase [Frankliniella fusca]
MQSRNTDTHSKEHASDSTDMKSLSLICKTSMPLFGDVMTKMYEIEAYSYDKLLPQLESIAKLTDSLPWPRCVHANVQGPPPHTIVLVDMRPERFVMADRSKFMDAEHCRLAMKQLARFHGAGLALKHRRPGTFDEFKKVLDMNIWDTAELRANQKPWTEQMVILPDVLKAKYPEGSDVHSRLKKIFEANRRDRIALMGPLDGPGYTFIHNDLHVNNMMFQYDKSSGAVTDCRIIDFQMSIYGPPARDVATVLMVCTDKPMRDKHWTSLLQTYHEEVLTTMKAAGCEDPGSLFSWAMLQDQMKLVSTYALCMSTMYYYGLFADDETINDLREMMAKISGGTDSKLGIKLIPNQLAHFEGLVEDLLDWGYLPTIEELEKQLAAYSLEKNALVQNEAK